MPLTKYATRISDATCADVLLQSSSTSSKMGLMSSASADRPGRVDHHRDERDDEPAAVRRRVAKQPLELVHSVNRYLSSTHSATTPSRHVIFLPSS